MTNEELMKVQEAINSVSMWTDDEIDEWEAKSVKVMKACRADRPESVECLKLLFDGARRMKARRAER
jgi:hypothetical protein